MEGYFIITITIQNLHIITFTVTRLTFFLSPGILWLYRLCECIFYSKIIEITYEYFPYILIEEMQLRKEEQSKFEEAELWFLLYVLSSAQVEMKRFFDVKIGDVKPENIFLNEDGEIKISCLYSWPGEMTNYSKSIELKETYLAPEEVEKLETGEVENLTSFQSEIFSIGITILSTLLLKDCYFLYDLRKPKFNYGKYNQLMDEFRKNNSYSEIFKAIVINLCFIEPEKRLTLEELWTFLNTYEKFIIKKCKFVIKNAPLKIETTIKELRAPQITYESKYISEVGSLSHQSTVSKKTAVEFLPFSHLSDAKAMQKSMSPIYGKVVSPSFMSGINFDLKENTKIVPKNNQVRFNYATGNRTINTAENNLESKNTVINQSVTIDNKQENQPQEEEKNTEENLPNKTELTSQEVQTFFTPPQSIVTEENNQSSSNNGDFVYTRRVVNLNTNSLLSERDIDENEYIQGIRRNVSQEEE